METERARAPECVNCGGDMALFRRDTTDEGTRIISLTWTVCTVCGHMHLEQWSIENGPEPAPFPEIVTG